MFQFCVSMMICYFDPNFVEICFWESVFSIFVVLRNHAEGKSVKWPPFWNGTLFLTFFSADNHSLTYSINGAIFIRKFHWESSFLKGVPRIPVRHQRVGNTLVTLKCFNTSYSGQLYVLALRTSYFLLWQIDGMHEVPINW